MLDILRPIFGGELARYGESLALLADHEDGRGARVLNDPQQLDSALRCYAEFLGCGYPNHAVVSNWTIHYFTALLPPVVAVLTLLQRTPVLAWPSSRVILDAAGLPTTFLIDNPGCAAFGSDTAIRYQSLLWEHLLPMVESLRRHTGVPKKIIWSNAVRALQDIFDRAMAIAMPEPALVQRLLGDRQQLLLSRSWPDGRSNPLFMRHRQVPVPTQPGGLVLHASCCLSYQIPSIGYCYACPLLPAHRPTRTVPATEALTRDG